MELDASVYAEWCMNKNIHRADFTQFENLLLQVGCHYSPGAKKTTLKMLKLQRWPVLSTDFWKSFAKCVSFYISRNPSSWMPQDQSTTTKKKKLATTDREAPTRCGEHLDLHSLDCSREHLCPLDVKRYYEGKTHSKHTHTKVCKCWAKQIKTLNCKLLSL